MADPNGFTHIKVTPEPEEDVVIHAGVGAGEAPSAPANPAVRVEPQQIPPARPQTQPQTAPAPVPAPAPQQVQEPAHASSEQPREPEREPRRAASPDAAAAARKKDDYHETTLEDLESTKMSLMQKCVIIGAVALLVIGAVYYFMLMG